MKKLRKLRNSNEGVVGIIVAFLLTGLIVVVISIIQTVYVPKWMEQSEAEHMEVVADQFSQLKFAIDTQSAIKEKDTPISTSITLGSNEMPFLSSNKAYGSLEILSEQFEITIEDDSSVSYSYPLNIIKYSCNNNYFLDQAYIFEAGAVIISQIEGDIMAIRPAFNITNEDDIIISFSIINIKTIGEKRSIGGYGTYPIQTEYSSSNPTPLPIEVIDNIRTIKISSDYPNSWEKFINKTFLNNGLKYNTDFSIESSESEVEIRFLTDYPTANLKIVNISTQIAPGWIENVKGI
jgi:hypothetical protein